MICHTVAAALVLLPVPVLLQVYFLYLSPQKSSNSKRNFSVCTDSYQFCALRMLRVHYHVYVHGYVGVQGHICVHCHVCMRGYLSVQGHICVHGHICAVHSVQTRITSCFFVGPFLCWYASVAPTYSDCISSLTCCSQRLSIYQRLYSASGLDAETGTNYCGQAYTTSQCRGVAFSLYVCG